MGRVLHLTVTRSLSLVAAACAAHAGAQPYAKTVWEHTVTGTEDARYACAVPLPDGDVLWIGDKEGTDGLTDVWVRRATPTGGLVWSQTYGKPGAPGACVVRQAALGPSGNVVIGCDVTGNATTYDTYLLKIDQDGNKLGEATFDFFAWDLLSDMKIGPSGNVVFASGGVDAEPYLLVKLDAALSLVWTLDLGNTGQDRQSPSNIQITPNGDVLVAGVVYDGVQQDVRLDRVSPTGSIVYSRDYGDPTVNDGYPTVLSGLNSKTYLAYTRRFLDPAQEARLVQIDQSGTTVWFRSDADITGANLAQTPTGEVLVCGATFPTAGVSSQKFAKFTETGTLVWSTTLDMPDVQHNWIRETALSPDGLVYTRAHFTPTGVSGSGWYVNCLTGDGTSVFQWRFQEGEDSYAFPNAMVPLDGGAVLVGGEVGDVLDDDAHVRRLQAELNAPVLSWAVRLGRLNRGNLASLTSDDDDYFELCKFVVPNQSTPPVNVEFGSLVPVGYPAGEVEFVVVSKAGTTGLSQNVELWNWSTGLWERSAVQAMSLAEQRTVVTGSVADNVQPGTGLVKARLRVSVVGLVLQNSWCMQIDQTNWLVRP